MEKPFGKRMFLFLIVVGLVALMFGLMACNGTDGVDTKPVAPERPVPGLPDPTPDEYGVITADAWMDHYPEIYASYKDNLSNAPGSAKHNYLEVYPALATLYAANAFSKGYNQAASHLFSLDSVRATPRISDASLSNCYTCKTPQLTNTVNTKGVETYAIPFAEAANWTEPISCFNCHANDPESITVGNQFWVKAVGADASKVPEAAMSCGQCHNEYYFDPATKATTNPYNGLATMTPEGIIKYYDEIGFKDWVYPVTETPMIKIQHPEFETVYGGPMPMRMARENGYSCADCHMGPVTADNGVEYSSHFWQSPLNNADLIANNCSQSGCHSDLAGQVKGWQDSYAKRVQSLSLDLEKMIKEFSAQVTAGSLSDEQIAQLRTIHRNAQIYWDFVMVENSNGAHNNAYATQYLDSCEKLIKEGNTILGI